MKKRYAKAAISLAMATVMACSMGTMVSASDNGRCY